MSELRTYAQAGRGIRAVSHVKPSYTSKMKTKERAQAHMYVYVGMFMHIISVSVCVCVCKSGQCTDMQMTTHLYKLVCMCKYVL